MGLNKIFQRLFQKLSRSENPCFHSPFAGVHNFGDFLIAEFLLLEQEYCCSLVFGEVLKGFLEDGFEVVESDGAVLRADGLDVGWILDIQRTTALVAIVVDQVMAGDLEQVGGELGSGFIAGGRFVDADEHHLREVFGLFPRLYGAVKVIDKRVLPAQYDFIKSLEVTRLQAQHAVHIGIIFVWVGFVHEAELPGLL